MGDNALVREMRKISQGFMETWRDQRNETRYDPQVQFFGAIVVAGSGTLRVILHAIPAKMAPPPQYRAQVLRALVQDARGVGGFFGAEAYSVQLPAGGQRSDLPADFADLPADQRQECLLFSLSWPLGSATFQALITDNVVGEWRELTGAEGRLTDMLGAETRPVSEVDA